MILNFLKLKIIKSYNYDFNTNLKISSKYFLIFVSYFNFDTLNINYMNIGITFSKQQYNATSKNAIKKQINMFLFHSKFFIAKRITYMNFLLKKTLKVTNFISLKKDIFNIIRVINNIIL